jgi:hypothetical protein
VLKLRGKYNNEIREIRLEDGVLYGHIPLISEIIQLSVQYEGLGLIPGPQYKPEASTFYRDETALILMFRKICTEVQTNKEVAAIPEDKGE